MKINKAYDRWAPSYDADDNLTRDLDAVVVQKALRGSRLASVIELGCGTGKNTGYLASISKRVLALDFSEGMLSRARAKVRASHVTFKRADILKTWPCASRSADLAICNLVLEHIKDLDFVFAEAHRVLRPRGRFFISELHPFRQYKGGQANFAADGGTQKVAAFVHHISDFAAAAGKTGFSIANMREWWHAKDEGKPPRLVSFVFENNPRRPRR